MQATTTSKAPNATSFRISHENYSNLTKLSKAQDRSKNYLINLILQDYFDRMTPSKLSIED